MSIRIPLAALAIVLLSSCFSAGKRAEYQKASPLLQEEIDTILRDLPHTHGPELIGSLNRLVFIGEPAIPGLYQTLRSRHSKSRSNAAYVLGEMHDRRAIPKLRKLLDDESKQVRYEVAASLVVLGDWTGIPILIESLKDEDPYHRFKGFRTLREHTHQDFGYDYQSPEEERLASVREWEEWYQQITVRNFP